MFGNSKNDDVAQQDDLQNFGDQQQNSVNAPSLPTMGGQNSPFSLPASPMPEPPQAPATSAPLTPQQDDPNAIPHHEDTQHMVTDHGTPDTPHDGSDVHNQAPGDLVGIKQQALSQLSPLVSHLDQSAEEKFRTTMMMIQATDDQSLLKEAYDAAQKIEDDKSRAQALLDVINEINYFTQQSK